MYSLHNITPLLFITVFILTGCSLVKKETNIEHSIQETNIQNAYQDIGYQYLDTRMDFLTKASQKEISSWDIDIRPDGKGLPDGNGSVAFGEKKYIQKCALCHGDFGEGVDRWPPLAGGQGSLKSQRIDGHNEGPKKTIGSYWPYASTIFDYIKRAMPYTVPQSLTNNEVYAITAYLLSLNEIRIDNLELDSDFVLGKHNFHKIKMPNEKNFYPKGDMKTPARPGIYNTRCMSDCKDTKPFKEIEVLKGVTPLSPLQRQRKTTSINIPSI